MATKTVKAVPERRVPGIAPPVKKPVLEIVLKCDSRGSVEAVTRSLESLAVPDVSVSVVHNGVGDISKSDVLFAETSSRLIVGFQVGVMHSLDKALKERRVEVRLYEVIYHLTADLQEIARNLIPPPQEDQVIGAGTVIALFKSARKGIIIGCQVQEGFFAVGERFRIISAMGPVYTGVMESLHIGNAEVRKATTGQQVGIRIKDFKKANIGDLVESFRPPTQTKAGVWEPTGRIVRI